METIQGIPIMVGIDYIADIEDCLYYADKKHFSLKFKDISWSNAYDGIPESLSVINNKTEGRQTFTVVNFDTSFHTCNTETEMYILYTCWIDGELYTLHLIVEKQIRKGKTQQ